MYTPLTQPLQLQLSSLLHAGYVPIVKDSFSLMKGALYAAILYGIIRLYYQRY